LTPSLTRLCVTVLLAGPFLAASPARAQTPAPGPTPTRTILASATLPSVVDAPLHFRLVRIQVPAGHVVSASVNGLVWVQSGAMTMAGDGTRLTVRDGQAMHVPSKRVTALKAADAGAVLFYWVLAPSDELARAVEAGGATLTEHYRTASPIPNLKAGPYEFSLTRVTFPPRLPPNRPHRRSGAALYYLASGQGVIVFDGKTESRPAGSIQYEPNDFVHQWGNPGDVPLVMIQGNISQEGVPVVIFDPTPR
jgi:mannose-6-phosphate isomerase-like protein (cupin superfamily)